MSTQNLDASIPSNCSLLRRALHIDVPSVCAICTNGPCPYKVTFDAPAILEGQVEAVARAYCAALGHRPDSKVMHQGLQVAQWERYREEAHNAIAMRYALHTTPLAL